MLLLQADSTNIVHQTFNMPSIAGWILGGLISTILCLVLTAIFYPFLEEKLQGLLARKLNCFHYSKGRRIAGTWTHKWHVISGSFNPINEINNIEIRQFGKKIYAKYKVSDNAGKIFTYEVFGKVDKDLFVTGTWKDIKSGHRYFGCFQLAININESSMAGYWTGVSAEKQIKSGVWEWFRED